MRKILRIGTKIHEMVPHYQARADDVSLKFCDKAAALDFLQEAINDCNNMVILRRTLEHDLFSPNISLMDDHTVLEQLAWILVSGQIKIVTGLRPAETTLLGDIPGPVDEQGEEEEQQEEEEAVEEAATIAPELDWIKFRVVEDVTGQPVSGVTLKVKLPTGEIWDFTTDGNGEIEIKDIPSGTCAILKMTDADALEVVQVS